MAVTPLYTKNDLYAAARSAAPVVVLAAASAATAAPAGDGFTTGPFGRVRILVDYTGAVTAANVRLWFKVAGVWYRGGSTDEGDALVPNVDEVQDWDDIGRFQEIAFQLEGISQTGGGTVAVRAMGVD